MCAHECIPFRGAIPHHRSSSDPHVAQIAAYRFYALRKYFLCSVENARPNDAMTGSVLTDPAAPGLFSPRPASSKPTTVHPNSWLFFQSRTIRLVREQDAAELCSHKSDCCPRRHLIESHHVENGSHQLFDHQLSVHIRCGSASLPVVPKASPFRKTCLTKRGRRMKASNYRIDII